MPELIEWREIVEYPTYLVSNTGLVKSLTRDCKRRSRKGNIYLTKYQERILKPRLGRNGYARVGLWNERGVKDFFIHRLVASAFIPNPLNYPYVNHLDCNPSNNCVQNLEWIDPKGNSCHAVANDRYAKGEWHGISVLKEHEVIMIAGALYCGVSANKVAKKFGVSPSTVQKIGKGETWNWLFNDSTNSVVIINSVRNSI